jgi:hypothetical protein
MFIIRMAELWSVDGGVERTDEEEDDEYGRGDGKSRGDGNNDRVLSNLEGVSYCTRNGYFSMRWGMDIWRIYHDRGS